MPFAAWAINVRINSHLTGRSIYSFFIVLWKEIFRLLKQEMSMSLLSNQLKLIQAIELSGTFGEKCEWKKVESNKKEWMKNASHWGYVWLHNHNQWCSVCKCQKKTISLFVSLSFFHRTILSAVPLTMWGDVCDVRAIPFRNLCINVIYL